MRKAERSLRARANVIRERTRVALHNFIETADGKILSTEPDKSVEKRKAQSNNWEDPTRVDCAIGFNDLRRQDLIAEIRHPIMFSRTAHQ
ncbi:hypothetical protein ABLO27_13115 [Roseibium sp. SCPC15]|uniref:hypothetical protein n=1 Tax=Roseibium sp. SCP15 TaxID=3141376 RepID=UPI003336D451